MYNWIARDMSGELYAFTVKPKKIDGVWTSKYNTFVEIPEYDERFKDVKFEDDEPLNISDLRL